MNKYILPSLLAGDFVNIHNELQKIETANLYFVHLDVMDGSFVPPITFGSQMIKAIHNCSPSLYLDVHLMTYNVSKHIDTMAASGANRISFHYEAEVHHNLLIQQIKNHNIQAGIVLVPSTPISILQDIVYDIDFVMLMSVNPGYGGQSFLSHSIHRLKQLNDMRKQLGLNFDIQVDGGINLDNADDLYKNGANNLVVGSFLFNSDNFNDIVSKFYEIAKKYA